MSQFKMLDSDNTFMQKEKKRYFTISLDLIILLQKVQCPT